MPELTEDELRVRCEELEKEKDQMKAEQYNREQHPMQTLTAEIPPMNSVKLSINAKGQLTGEVKVYNQNPSHAYAQAFQIIKIIKAKNEGIVV